MVVAKVVMREAGAGDGSCNDGGVGAAASEESLGVDCAGRAVSNRLGLVRHAWLGGGSKRRSKY